MTRPLGGYIGFNRVPTQIVASGVWTLREQERFRLAGTWPVLFTPAIVPGLNLWLDFSQTTSVTLDGSNISAISDLSGNGYHASASVGNRPTTSTMNGLACANWGTAANNYRLAYSSGSDNRNWQEVFVVAVWDGTQSTFPSFNGLFTGSTNTGTGSGQGILGNSSSASWYEIGSGSWPTNVVLNNIETTTAFNTIKSPFVLHFWSSNIAVNGYCIGQDRQITVAGNRGWQGRICEVIAYNTALSTESRTDLRSYLSSKWGIV